MNNRQTILTCALELFASNGYDDTGIQEIVDAAGITKPTLYYYFGSKRGLLDCLLEEHFKQLNAAIKTASVYHADLTATLDRVAEAYFRFARENQKWYRMQLSMWFAPEGSESYQAVAILNVEHYQILENLFLQAAHDHGNMKDRQRAYAATLLGMLNTYIGMAFNGYVELNDSLRRQAVHQFMHGIFS